MSMRDLIHEMEDILRKANALQEENKVLRQCAQFGLAAYIAMTDDLFVYPEHKDLRAFKDAYDAWVSKFHKKDE